MKRLALLVLLLFVVGCDCPASKPKIKEVIIYKEGKVIYTKTGENLSCFRDDDHCFVIRQHFDNVAEVCNGDSFEVKDVTPTDTKVVK